MKVAASLRADVGAQHLSGGDVERGHETGGAAADVLELAAGMLTGRDWSGRVFGAARGDRGLLVHGQDQRVDRRVQVQPADVGGALPELWGVTAVEPAGDLVDLQVQALRVRPT